MSSFLLFTPIVAFLFCFVLLSPVPWWTATVGTHPFLWALLLLSQQWDEEELPVIKTCSAGCSWANESASLGFFKILPQSLLQIIPLLGYCIVYNLVPASHPSRPLPISNCPLSSHRKLFPKTFLNHFNSPFGSLFWLTILFWMKFRIFTPSN